MKRRHHPLVAAVAAAAAAQFAWAQQGQPQLEEIVVTAERREASLQETDIAITAFGEETLREMGVSNVLDLSGFAPSVLAHEMPGKAGMAISIRGLKNAETIATFEPKVALYLDGVIIAKNAGALMDVLDLERVEVLRGPQGTLYGRNTTGGAVNLITKKPDLDAFGGRVAATLGDFDQRDLKGSLNLPLIPGSLALKASLASLERDGYWKNGLTGADLGDKNRTVALVQVKWQPAENFSALYSFDRTEVNEGVQPMQLVGATRPDLLPWVADGSSSKRYLDFTDEFQEATMGGHSLTLEWDLADTLQLVSITAVREAEIDAGADSDGSPVFVLHNFSGDEMETWTQELRLVGSALDERLDFVLGAFYMDEDIKETYSVPQIGIGIPWAVASQTGFYFVSGNFAYGKNENWALFGEGTYALTDRLDLTLGVRYTKEDRTLGRYDETGVVAFGTRIIPLPEAQGDFDDVSWTGSLTYQWTPQVMTYFKVAKGYNSGGFNARAPTSDPETFLKGYDEETLYLYELGWKTEWLDNRLRVNGAIFYNDYQDLQVNQLTPDGKNAFGNAGDATLKGAELEVLALLTERLQVGGSYGYLDPEYKKYIDPSGKDLSRNHWAHAPENTVNLFARYEVPDFQGIGNLVARIDYAFVDDHFLLTANDPGLIDGNTAPSYHLVNARLSLEGIRGPGGSTFTIALWGRNLTDDLWYTSGYDLSNGALGMVDKATAPPRTYGLDLSLDW